MADVSGTDDSDVEAGPLIKNGYLYLRVGTLMKNWERRRFVLEEGKLYYGAQGDPYKLKTLVIDSTSEVKEHDVGKPNSWEMSFQGQTLYVHANSLAEKLEWLKVLLLQVSKQSSKTSVLKKDNAGHQLKICNYMTPTDCDMCGKLLWGLVRQGLKCEGCEFNFHQKCVNKGNLPGCVLFYNSKSAGFEGDTTHHFKAIDPKTNELVECDFCSHNIAGSEVRLVCGVCEYTCHKKCFSSVATACVKDQITNIPGLPPGWELVIDDDGRKIYVNHITMETAWVTPVEELRYNAGDNDRQSPICVDEESPYSAPWPTISQRRAEQNTRAVPAPIAKPIAVVATNSAKAPGESLYDVVIPRLRTPSAEQAEGSMLASATAAMEATPPTPAPISPRGQHVATEYILPNAHPNRVRRGSDVSPSMNEMSPMGARRSSDASSSGGPPKPRRPSDVELEQAGFAVQNAPLSTVAELPTTAAPPNGSDAPSVYEVLAPFTRVVPQVQQQQQQEQPQQQQAAPSVLAEQTVLEKKLAPPVPFRPRKDTGDSGSAVESPASQRARSEASSASASAAASLGVSPVITPKASPPVPKKAIRGVGFAVAPAGAGSPTVSTSAPPPPSYNKLRKSFKFHPKMFAGAPTEKRDSTSEAKSSFDTPLVVVKTLENPTKDRVGLGPKRRPPTRKPREDSGDN